MNFAYHVAQCAMRGNGTLQPPDQPVGTDITSGRQSLLAPQCFTFTDVKRPLLPAVTDSYIVGLICPDDAPNCRIPSRIEGPVVIGAHARLAFSGSGDNSFPYYIIECAP